MLYVYFGSATCNTPNNTSPAHGIQNGQFEFHSDLMAAGAGLELSSEVFQLSWEHILFRSQCDLHSVLKDHKGRGVDNHSRHLFDIIHDNEIRHKSSRLVARVVRKSY